MKKILVFASLALLVACKKESTDTRTPKGIIFVAVQALNANDVNKFKSLLADRALQNYGSSAQQSQLKTELGDVRKLSLSDEKILSHSTSGSTITTISQVDVLQSGRVIRNVITRCAETNSSYTHQVCRTYDPHPDYNDHSGGYGGGYSGGHDDDNGGSSGGGGGGYITPGPSAPVRGEDNGDGRRPGNSDPGRPGRYPIVEAASLNQETECHDETSYDVSVNCQIIDLK